MSIIWKFTVLKIHVNLFANNLVGSSDKYKHELALVLNGTIGIPCLNSLEQKIFQNMLKQKNCPESAKKNYNQKYHCNYLLLDSSVLDRCTEESSGTKNSNSESEFS